MMKRGMKSLVAGISVCLILFTGINIANLQSVSAEELSGYRIDTAYSEDKTEAMLSGNLDNVPQTVELTAITDPNGDTHNPMNFQYTVSENGEYQFVLQYKEITEEAVIEQQEVIRVTVNEIAETQPEESVATAEQPAQESADSSQEQVEYQEPETPAPPTLPLSVLEKQVFADDRPEEYFIQGYQYAAEEKGIKLKDQAVSFSGGVLTAETAPAYSGGSVERVYSSAAYVYKEDPNTIYPITGFFPIKNGNRVDWYYTTQEVQTGQGSYDNITVGYLLDITKVEIRFYYSVANQQSFNITPVDQSTSPNIGEWKVQNKKNAKQGEKVVVQFTLPVKYKSAKIWVYSGGKDYYIFDTQKLGNGIEKGNEPYSYIFTFEMPNGNTELRFVGNIYDKKETRYFSAFSDNDQWQTGERGRSLVYTTKIGDKVISSPIYDKWSSEIYGLGDYISGGEPYFLREQYDRKYGADQTDHQNVQKGQYSMNVVSNPISGKKMTAPVSTFVPGEEVKFIFETGRGHSSLGWGWKPYILNVDVYEGADNFETSNFKREQIVFPTKVNDTVSLDLSMGGNVTVKCLEYNNTRPDNEYKRELHWYKYEVTVTGVSYAFKLVQSEASSAQVNYVVNQMDGIEEGEGTRKANNSKSDINGSYVYYKDEAGLGFGPLKNNTSLLAQNVINDKQIYYGLKVKEGYSLPSATLKTYDSKVKLLPPESAVPDEQGRYMYTLDRTNNSGDQENFNSPSTLSFVSEPINFKIEYYYNSQEYGKPSGGNPILTVNNLENYVIENKIPSLPQGQYLEGFEVLILPNGNFDESYKVPRLATGTNNVWHSGDVINVNNIYDYISKKGWLKAGVTSYNIRIRAKTTTSSTNSWLPNLQYKIYEQKQYNLYNNGSITDHYKPANFTEVKSGTVGGYQGSSVVLGRYPETVENDRGKFVLGGFSQTGTDRVESNGQLIGQLFYISAANVQVDLQTLNNSLSQQDKNSLKNALNAANTWNTNNAHTLFTGSNQEQHVIDINSIHSQMPATLSDGRKFKGWTLKKADGGTFDFAINFSSTLSNLNLYLMGNGSQNYGGEQGKAAWNEIFGTMVNGKRQKGTGQITLVPVYEDTTKPIGSVQSPTATKTVYTKTGFDIVNSYTYTGNWETQKNDFYVALWRDKGNQSELWVKKSGPVNGGANKVTFNAATDIVATPTNTNKPEEGGTVTVTYHVKGHNDIVKSKEDQAVYTAYAWNSKNGNGQQITADNKESLKLAAKFTTNVTMKPLAIQSTSSNMHQELSTMTVHPEQDFELSAATFKYDTGYYEGNNPQSIAESLKSDLNLALYKQPPNQSNTYNLWADKNGGTASGMEGSQSKVAAPTISVDTAAGTFSVSYQIKNIVKQNKTSTVDWSYDHNAKYRVYAWNETNGNYTSNNVHTNGQQSVPSITTPTQMAFHEPEYYVEVPKQLALTDDQGFVEGEQSSSYAGVLSKVAFKTKEDGSQIANTLPSIRVKVEDKATMTINGTSAGADADTREVLVYDQDGNRNEGTNQDGKLYSDIGILSQDTQSLPFRLNTLRSPTLGVTYIATIHYLFEPIQTTP